MLNLSGVFRWGIGPLAPFCQNNFSIRKIWKTLFDPLCVSTSGRRKFASPPIFEILNTSLLYLIYFECLLRMCTEMNGFKFDLHTIWRGAYQAPPQAPSPFFRVWFSILRRFSFTQQTIKTNGPYEHSVLTDAAMVLSETPG